MIESSQLLNPTPTPTPSGSQLTPGGLTPKPKQTIDEIEEEVIDTNNKLEVTLQEYSDFRKELKCGPLKMKLDEKQSEKLRIA